MDKPKKDEILDLQIIDLSFEGLGIAKIEGDFVVFIDGAVPDDLIKASVKKVKKNYSEAKLIEILKSSEYRTRPRCEYFGTCNGCKMQNIDYEYQLKIKRQNVINAFERIGGFKNIFIPEIIKSEEIYYYRNKLEFSFSKNRWLTKEELSINNIDKSFALGFHMPNFIDKILDVKRCYLQSEISNKILNLTRDFFKSKDATIYSSRTNSGYLRYLVIRQSKQSEGLMINLITSSVDKFLLDGFSKLIRKEIPEVTTLVNTISTTKAQAALCDYYNIIFGKGFITEKVGEFTFKITPNSFFQTNTQQTKKLFDTLINLSKFSKNENVLDLYCGSGAISIYISNYVNKVTGVEYSKESILTARENAKCNNVTTCEFNDFDVKDYLLEMIKGGNFKFETVILDPPRSGIHPKAAEYLLKLEPKKIIYVSCNPTTQARDVKLLGEKYEIKEIQPVDMFPQTMHIENIMRLDLK
ncbi:MAG: 23S rRNA (uracil(1939)-C(5))-methyltransferase RlmD [Ignavibacteria bacterium]